MLCSLYNLPVFLFFRWNIVFKCEGKYWSWTTNKWKERDLNFMWRWEINGKVGGRASFFFLLDMNGKITIIFSTLLLAASSPFSIVPSHDRWWFPSQPFISSSSLSYCTFHLLKFHWKGLDFIVKQEKINKRMRGGGIKEGDWSAMVNQGVAHPSLQLCHSKAEGFPSSSGWSSNSSLALTTWRAHVNFPVLLPPTELLGTGAAR